MVDKKEDIKKRIIRRFEEEIEKFYLGKTHQSVSQIHEEFKEYFSDKTVQDIGKTSFPEDYKKIWSKPKVPREVYLDIKERIANEIKSFYSGCSATPLAQIYREFECVVNSVDTITYIAKKEFPNEYNEIWARPPLPEEVRIEIINSLKNEIEKYDNGIKPRPLSRIHNDFQKQVKSLDVIIKIAKDKFPKYYEKIWVKVKITPEIRNKTIKRIKEEIDILKSGSEPMTIRDIWKESFEPYMSEGQLGEIGREIYPEDYNMIWSAHRIPSDVKNELLETINNEISNYDLGKETKPIRQIQREFDEWVKSKDHIISIAKNLNPEKYEEIWSVPRIPEHIKIQVIEEVENEINKYKNDLETRTIKEIWKVNFIQYIKTRDTISDIAREAFPEEYELIWGKEIPSEKRLGIIQDILDYNNVNVRTMGQIAQKHGVSNTTVMRISVNEVECVYSDFSHEVRFYKDFFADLGITLHNIIKHLVTMHFWGIGFKIYSEIIVDFYTNVFVDNFSLNIKPHNYLHRILDCKRYLVDEMGLDIDELKKIKAFMFDYTNNVSEENYKDKVKKYQKKDILLFIVGTRWPKKNKKRIIDTKYKNVRIIKHDLFAELIELDGDLLKMFEYIIELNYMFDLSALKETFMDIKEDFLNMLGRYLFVNSDLREDLEKMGLEYMDFF